MTVPETPNARTMQQCVATKKGGPLQVVTGAYPNPGPDEICIRNRAVALNAIDWKRLHGGAEGMTDSKAAEVLRKKVQAQWQEGQTTQGQQAPQGQPNQGQNQGQGQQQQQQQQQQQMWPDVLGVDTAGVVEVVGANVTTFKAGDAVMASAGLGGRRGAFQDVTAVPAHFASRKPAGWSFAQACSTPICYLAAAAAVTQGLGVPLPHLQTAAQPREIDHIQRIPRQNSVIDAKLPPPPPPPPRCVLVVGGSSGVGASAVQLLRAALPAEAVIVSTNSPAHNAHVTGLGASACVDRNLPLEKLVSAINRAAGAAGVEAIIDAVGHPEAGKLCEGVLLPPDAPAPAQQQQQKQQKKGGNGNKGGNGGGTGSEGEEEEGTTTRPQRLYAHVVTGAAPPSSDSLPSHVRAAPVYAHMMFATPDGRAAMTKFVDLVDEGKFKLPLEIEIVGRGLDDIAAGLERLRAGVSGTKLVVSL